MGLVAHDTCFTQLLFGVLPAVGKLAPLATSKILSDWYAPFYGIPFHTPCDFYFTDNMKTSRPTAGSILKRSWLNNLPRMATLASS